MKYPIILVGAPTYEGKEYSRERYIHNISRLNYPNYHWCLVDNTAHTRYYNKLKRKHPRNIFRVPRGKNSRDGIANSMNFLRHKVLDEGYEYLMIVESDLFPDEDVIQRLLSHNDLVVGHPYYIGFGENKHLCVSVPHKTDEGLWGTRFLTPEESAQALDGTKKRVQGMGVGCVLIHRSILERYSFWYSYVDDDRLDAGALKKHPDVYFYMDLWNDQVPVYLDTSVVIPHDNKSWHLVKDA